MKFIVYSLIKVFCGLSNLKHISTLSGINATIHADFSTQNGKDIAKVENTDTSSPSKVTLCSFTKEGDVITVIKDYSTSMKTGANYITLPSLDENKYYFFRSIVGNDIKYSDSYVKTKGNWQRANAGTTLPTTTQEKNNDKEKLNNKKKKKLKESQNNKDPNIKNDEGGFNWIIWICVTVIVVLLIGLVIGVICCR